MLYVSGSHVPVAASQPGSREPSDTKIEGGTPLIIPMVSNTPATMSLASATRMKAPPVPPANAEKYMDVSASSPIWTG